MNRASLRHAIEIGGQEFVFVLTLEKLETKVGYYEMCKKKSFRRYMKSCTLNVSCHCPFEQGEMDFKMELLIDGTKMTSSVHEIDFAGEINESVDFVPKAEHVERDIFAISLRVNGEIVSTFHVFLDPEIDFSLVKEKAR